MRLSYPNDAVNENNEILWRLSLSVARMPWVNTVFRLEQGLSQDRRYEQSNADCRVFKNSNDAGWTTKRILLDNSADRLVAVPFEWIVAGIPSCFLLEDSHLHSYRKISSCVCILPIYIVWMYLIPTRLFHSVTPSHVATLFEPTFICRQSLFCVWNLFAILWNVGMPTQSCAIKRDGVENGRVRSALQSISFELFQIDKDTAFCS